MHDDRFDDDDRDERDDTRPPLAAVLRLNLPRHSPEFARRVQLARHALAQAQASGQVPTFDQLGCLTDVDAHACALRDLPPLAPEATAAFRRRLTDITRAYGLENMRYIGTLRVTVTREPQPGDRPVYRAEDENVSPGAYALEYYAADHTVLEIDRAAYERAEPDAVRLLTPDHVAKLTTVSGPSLTGLAAYKLSALGQSFAGRSLDYLESKQLTKAGPTPPLAQKAG